MARINKSKVNFKAFNKLLKDLDRKVSIKVGILGTKGREPVSEDLDMAGLGAVHEFGTTIPVTDKMRGWFWYTHKIHKKNKPIVIPARSFLRDSLLTADGKRDLQKEARKKLTGDIDLDRVLAQDESFIFKIATAIGSVGANRVNEAFQSRGFGKWKLDSEFTLRQKGSAMPLVDNGHLEGAISYEVKEL